MSKESQRQVIRKYLDRIDQMKFKFSSIMAEKMLSERTQQVRRNLLVASIFSFAVSILGFIPEKIEAFGVTFKAQQQSYLLWLAAVFTLYFLISFVTHFMIEYKKWIYELDSALLTCRDSLNGLNNNEYCLAVSQFINETDTSDHLSYDDQWLRDRIQNEEFRLKKETHLRDSPLRLIFTVIPHAKNMGALLVLENGFPTLLGILTIIITITKAIGLLRIN
ncbi:MAG: hypothetical protein U9R17_09395 [Thermodesulfobacteriota bacterium]|nr:hypothetical protein [Thermodesulfobacteriota bacterium]